VAKRRSKKTKKTRKTAKSSSSPARKRVGAKKAKTSRKRVSQAPAKNALDLKKLRRDLERAVAALGSRSTRDPEQQRVLAAAQERMTRWIAEADDFCTPEMQEVCGPTMEIEFP
jgi:transcription initiation factor IIF auxiliary subunit